MSGRGRRGLKRLLDIRRLKESSSRQEYGLAMRSEETAIDREATAMRALLASQQGVLSRLGGGVVAVEALRRITEELGFRERVKNVTSERRQVLSGERQKAETVYRLSRRDKRSLERLQDRQRDADSRARRKAEQVLTDEAALRKFMIRSDGATAGGGNSGF